MLYLVFWMTFTTHTIQIEENWGRGGGGYTFAFKMLEAEGWILTMDALRKGPRKAGIAPYAEMAMLAPPAPAPTPAAARKASWEDTPPHTHTHRWLRVAHTFTFTPWGWGWGAVRSLVRTRSHSH